MQAAVHYSVPTGVTVPNPGGTLSFYEGAQLLGTAPLTYANFPCNFICNYWQGTFQTTTLSVGVHTITVVYGGDGLYEPSTGNPLTITINARPPTPTSVTTTTDAIVYQGSVPGSGIVYAISIPPPTSITLLEGDIAVMQAAVHYSVPS